MIPSVVLPMHPAKVCIYGNLHYVALKLFCWEYFVSWCFFIANNIKFLTHVTHVIRTCVICVMSTTPMIVNMNIGIKHGFSCINIRKLPMEVLKTVAEGRGFQHLHRDLANVNALKNHVRSLLLHKNWKQLLHFALFLHFFVSPFHRCLTNAISTDYARSRAGQYTSRNGSKCVAPVRPYWKLRSRALTARELSC